MIFSLCFVLWLTLMKHQSVTKTKHWHTIFSQLFSFTSRHKLCLSEYSPSRSFLHVLCVFDRLDASEAQSVLCLSVLERAAHARAHTHTHTHFSLGNSISRVDCTFNILLSNMSSKFSNCKDGILQQSTNDWSDSEVLVGEERMRAAVKGRKLC